MSRLTNSLHRPHGHQRRSGACLRRRPGKNGVRGTEGPRRCWLRTLKPNKGRTRSPHLQQGKGEGVTPSLHPPQPGYSFNTVGSPSAKMQSATFCTGNAFHGLQAYESHRGSQAATSRLHQRTWLKWQRRLHGPQARGGVALATATKKTGISSPIVSEATAARSWATLRCSVTSYVHSCGGGGLAFIPRAFTISQTRRGGHIFEL